MSQFQINNSSYEHQTMEEMLNYLINSRGFIKSYKLEMPWESLYRMLGGALQFHVASRYREFQPGSKVEQIVERVAKWLTRKQQPWLLLSGNPGNGKTTFVYAIATVIDMLNITCDNRPVRLVTREAQDICECVRRNDSTLQTLIYEPMLAIDDLGNEPTLTMNYGATVSAIDTLLNARYRAGRFTVMTSNLSTTELRNKYGERLHDRLKELTYVVSFETPSYR